MIVTAQTTFFRKESRIPVRAGECYDDTHPIVRQFPHLFAPVETVDGGVEQATSGPGEKRAARRPRKTATAVAVDPDEGGE